MNDTTQDLNRHAVDWWQVIKNRLGTILLTSILTFAVAAVITYIMPRKYRGRVELKIERKPEILQLDDSNNYNPMAASESYIKTEFETITKAETIYPVIEQFELAKRWGLSSRLDAFHRLMGNLDPIAAVRSDFVILEYYDEEPKLAADVVNAVADSYMKKRIEKAAEHKDTAMISLKKKIEMLDAEASVGRKKLISIMKEQGIVDVSGGMTSSRAPGMMVENPASITNTYRENELYKLEADILAMQADVDVLSKLSPDQLVERKAGLNIENSTWDSLRMDYVKLLGERQDLVNSGRGVKHPTITGIDAKIASHVEQILLESGQHLAGLRSRLAASLNRKDELKKLHETTKEDAIEKQGSSFEYLTAKRQLEDTESTLLKMKEKYYTSEVNEGLDKAPATIWQKAEIESAPAKPRVALNLALGGLVGLLFGLGLAFGLEFMDTTVKSIDDVERYLGIPVLAIVPKGVGVLHHSNGLSPDAEAYRILRTNLEFNRKNANANCLSVVSGSAGEGKSTTICNLAFVCAQAGYNVLLIDGDLRRPRQHTLFNTTNAVGLSNYLATDIPLQEVVMQTAIPNLYFLPSGPSPADSAGLLNSARMTDLIADVKSRFDLVLIDSPPILGVSDAAVIASEADATIIVLQHRKLPRQMLFRVKQAVQAIGGTIAGAVLNNVDTRSDASYQYYTSYYSYYSSTNPTDDSLKAKKRKKRSVPPDASAPVVASATAPRAQKPTQSSDLF